MDETIAKREAATAPILRNERATERDRKMEIGKKRREDSGGKNCESLLRRSACLNERLLTIGGINGTS